MTTVPQAHPFKRMRRVFPVNDSGMRNTSSYFPFDIVYSGTLGINLISASIFRKDGGIPTVDEVASAVQNSISEGDLYIDYEAQNEGGLKFYLCDRVLSVEHSVDNTYFIQMTSPMLDPVVGVNNLTVFGIGPGMTAPFYLKAMPITLDEQEIEIDFFSYGGDRVFPFYLYEDGMTPIQLSVFGTDEGASIYAANDGWKFYMLW